MVESVTKVAFKPAPQWKSIFKQDATGAGLGVYVDDFELVAPPGQSAGIWAELAKHIEFKEEPRYWGEAPTRHLGCNYTVERKKVATGDTVTTIRSQMKDYFLDIVRRFEERTGVTVPDAPTPWLDSGAASRHEQEQSQAGNFGDIAASPLMAGLYGARATRPDHIIATLRQARRINKWTKFDDRKLIRYLGYVRASAGLTLSGSLSTADEKTAVVRCWPDADLAGDPAEDTKSTSGGWVEIASLDGERSMGVHWGASKQTSTADSTTQAELASMHSLIKSDGLPIASLMEFLLGRDIIMEVMEDNTAAIQAAKAGYSSKFRHLHRSKRIDLGWLGEVFEDSRNRLLYGDTATHKGDLLTKEFGKERFEQCKRLVHLGAVVLPEAEAREYICHNGVLTSIGKRVAAAAAESSAGSGHDLVAGVNSWVVDTGSGHNLVPKSGLLSAEEANLRATDSILKLATANGVVEADQITDCMISRLGEAVQARVLESTPRVLSVHQLVRDHGAKFEWDVDGARLLLHGRLYRLPIKQGVPLLALPSIEK